MKKEHKELIGGLAIILLILFLGNPSKKDFKKYYKDKIGYWSTNSYERDSYMLFSIHRAESYNLSSIYQEDTYLAFGFFGWEYFYKIR